MNDEPAPKDNRAQAALWAENGPAWVRLQEHLDGHLEPFGREAIDQLAPAGGEYVLDVGCGCGATTIDLARRVGAGGAAHGVDLSPPMVERARERATEEGLTHVTFAVADAQIAPLASFDHGYDAAFSRFGVMFFADPVAAFTNIANAVRPNGRLAFVCWQDLEKNPWLQVPLAVARAHVELPPPAPPDAPGPMSLADSGRITNVLDDAGWRSVDVRGWIDERFYPGTPTDVATGLIELGPLRRVIEVADPAVVAAITAGVADALEPFRVDGGARISSAAWVVSARRP